MSWFIFDEETEKIQDLFELEPAKGLIFNSIKAESEFEFVTIDVTAGKEQDGSTDTDKRISE